MTEKTLTTENIKPALDALRGELAPWPVVAMKQDKLNDTQKSAVNSGITSSLVAQITANTAAIRALESAITGTGLRALVVSSLPAVGTLGILYIVPVTTYDPETDADVVNYSNEYLWIVAPDAPATEGYYEQVGQTGIVINNGQLTITVNGTSVGTFTANQSGDTTAAITVPTNADYVDKTTAQSIAGVKTFSDGIVGNVTGNVTGNLTGTASKAISDEDGTSIKTGYVNVAGNQTVTGQKTWSGNQTYQTTDIYYSATNPRYVLKSTGLEKGVQPAGNYTATCHWSDKNGNDLGYTRFVEYNNSIQTYEIYVSNKASNGALDPNGSQIAGGLQLALFPISATSSFVVNTTNVIPGATNAIDLGSSTNQWSSVYAQSYYYNGVAWGLDKANVWTNGQTYSAYNYGQMFWLKNTGLDFSVNGNTGLTDTYQHMILWVDKNNAIYSSIHSWTASSENTLVLRSYYRTDANTVRDLSVRFTSTATNKVVYPETNADTELGALTNKWKTLNGINPGALSLPSSNYVDISGDIIVRDGSAANSLTASCDGWIAIYTFASWLQISNDTLLIAVTGAIGADGFSQAFVPVRTGDSIRILVNQTNTLFQSFKLLPCLGNV